MEDIREYGTIRQIVASLEREAIMIALEETRWNVTRAAKELGVTFRSLRYRMGILGLKRNTDIVRVSYGKDWPKLRFDALRKYGNRCHCCGSTPNSGVVLHVDHVKPRSKYPELAMDINNLQILCARCHLSKGANDETDWR